MVTNEKKIFVYADWIQVNGCKPFGILTCQQIRGKEIFSFEYNEKWLSVDQSLFLDPNLSLYKGRQFAPVDKPNFGIFLDSSPDRWGKMLMRRREAAFAKKENRSARTLFESDYLLGVYDGTRLGGLRFKTDEKGDFQNNQRDGAAPPWTSIRDLEYASLQLENEDAVNDPEYLNWLSILVDPGSSLGGARPKASVVDETGELWVAKFPSSSDDKDSGAWENVLAILAEQCGITVPIAKSTRFSGKHHTYLSKRFDRTSQQKRIHFASAMTLLGYNDGDDFTEGASYLELIGFIQQHGANMDDLEQLWKRIVFNIMVSNTDDHLRNHGFLLASNGWELSPAYDLNPNETGNGLRLNITETNNALDLSLALEIANHCRLNSNKANKIISDMKKVIGNWRAIARTKGIGNSEIEQLENAFKQAK